MFLAGDRTVQVSPSFNKNIWKGVSSVGERRVNLSLAGLAVKYIVEACALIEH